MVRPLRIQFPSALNDITSRGNERSPVFLSQRDREKFLSYPKIDSIDSGTQSGWKRDFCEKHKEITRF